MKDDIILNKSEIIKNCLKSIRNNYALSPEKFLTDYIRQDAAIINIQRAVQASIDIAAHIVRLKKLSLPKETKDLFVSLHDNKIISKNMSEKMKSMVGFRNISVHEYKKVDMNIVVSVINKNLEDFEFFLKEILNYEGK